MTNYDLEESNLLKWQFGLSLLFIFTIIVSLTLTYNEILKCEKKAPLFDEDTEIAILKINRLLGVLLSLGFLIINIIDKNIKSKHNHPLQTANLQIWAGTFNLISTLIVLYVAFTSYNIVNLENPEL